MPCPSSALPVKTVIAPSASIRIQESRKGASSRLPGSSASAAGAASPALLPARSRGAARS